MVHMKALIFSSAAACGQMSKNFRFLTDICEKQTDDWVNLNKPAFVCTTLKLFKTKCCLGFTKSRNMMIFLSLEVITKTDTALKV